MERTMISWNVPNLITINLMAWLGFLAFVLFYQGVGKRRGKGAPTTAGSAEIVSVGEGY